MEMKPSEIIASLSKEDQELLNAILKIEKSRLHIEKIKPGTRDEREIVKEIVDIIDKAVSNVN